MRCCSVACDIVSGTQSAIQLVARLKRVLRGSAPTAPVAPSQSRDTHPVELNAEDRKVLDFVLENQLSMCAYNNLVTGSNRIHQRSDDSAAAERSDSDNSTWTPWRGNARTQLSRKMSCLRRRRTCLDGTNYSAHQTSAVSRRTASSGDGS